MHQTGVLLIHGLMGSPKEYTPLEGVLRASGYHTKTVTLPGHGVEPETPFHQVAAPQLVDHCLNEYDAFSQDVDEVVVLGHSLGGICTMITASHQPDKLKGIVVVSAPYEHAYWVNRTHGLLKVPFKTLVNGLKYAPECRTGFERPHFKPWMFPRMLRESRTMLGTLQERLPLIQVPVHLAHSRYDLSIPYTEMFKLNDALVNAPQVTTLTLENSGHQIFPRSRDKEKTTLSILEFVDAVCPKAVTV